MKKLVFLIALLLVFVVACATTPPAPLTLAPRTDAPLPADITIIPADPNLPAAKFLGKWFGRWDGVMDHYLIVTEVLSDNGQDIVHKVSRQDIVHNQTLKVAKKHDIPKV